MMAGPSAGLLGVDSEGAVSSQLSLAPQQAKAQISGVAFYGRATERHVQGRRDWPALSEVTATLGM